MSANKHLTQLQLRHKHLIDVLLCNSSLRINLDLGLGVIQKLEIKNIPKFPRGTFFNIICKNQIFKKNK